MAQVNKGKRELVGARLAKDVYEELARAAEAHNISMSQYVADVMALHFGRDDLVLELDRPRRPRAHDLRKKGAKTQQELPLAG
ncbi:toxin-antitoxin system [Nocardia thailandica]|uniref:Toxin-antitoxin system n=1 Tax=Nocardia thailandica TaxID=257275 RepID=A0ABW6PWQ5_9NOCA